MSYDELEITKNNPENLKDRLIYDKISRKKILN